MSKQVNKATNPQNEGKFALARENYKLLLIGFGIIVLGFILMAGGGSKDPNVFSQDIFSFRRITLAPIVVLFGFAFEIYAIMKKPKR
jgi:membrane-bound ClpP family serine protease